MKCAVGDNYFWMRVEVMNFVYTSFVYSYLFCVHKIRVFP